MSYLSRLYNHRNAQSVAGKDKPFFSRKSDENGTKKKDSFFQTNTESIQRATAPDKEKKEPKIQKMELPEKKKEEGPPPAHT